MVGNLPPPGLCSFSTERRRSVDVKTTRELQISATKLDARGWMSQNYPPLQRREKYFLLTSPFIEPGHPSVVDPPASVRMSTVVRPPTPLRSARGVAARHVTHDRDLCTWRLTGRWRISKVSGQAVK